MRVEILWVRAGYWVAAIADFVVAALVLIPERMGVAGYLYPMGLMASVAFSWGVLLLIADRRPLERRWVLVPTMLVVFLLGVTAAHAGYVGLIPAGRASATAVVTAIILLILAVGHHRSGRIA